MRPMATRLSASQPIPIRAEPPPSVTSIRRRTIPGTSVYSGKSARTGSRPPTTRAFATQRSEEHTSELQSPYVISYAVFCLKKKTPVATLLEQPLYHHADH